jgi:chromosome segregation ATPase
MDEIQSLRERITTLEQLLENSRAAASQMLDERDSVRVELEGALLQIKDLQFRLQNKVEKAEQLIQQLDIANKAAADAEIKLVALGGSEVLGIASLNGKTLAEIKEDIRHGRKPT